MAMRKCWCGTKNPYFSTVRDGLDRSCDGSGTLYCLCGDETARTDREIQPYRDLPEITCENGAKYVKYVSYDYAKRRGMKA